MPSPLDYPDIPLGRYRHFKGGEYTVIGVALHTNHADRYVVVYRNDAGNLFVRSAANFLEKVPADNSSVLVARFTSIS